MYGAIFEMECWMGRLHFFTKGKTAGSLLTQFGHEQNLECLLSNGRYQEDKKGQLELDKLEALLKKHRSRKLTVDDLRGFSIKISLGTIKCLELVDGEEAVTALKEKYPRARVCR